MNKADKITNEVLKKNLKNILLEPDTYKFRRGTVSGFSIEEETGTDPVVYGSYLYYDNEDARNKDLETLTLLILEENESNNDNDNDKKI